MKKVHPVLLSAFTGLLLYAAWPESPLTLLIFIAFVPLLWLERQGIRRARFFGWTYVSMFLWNIGSTWWIWNASIPGAICAIVLNSLLMCLPWLGFHWIRRRMGNNFGYCSLIIFWLSFEYLHLQNWGLSWPWLTLGNVFASHPQWVPWYSFTGTSGGSLWILIVNLLLFRWLWQLVKHHKFHTGPLAGALALVLLPIFLAWATEGKPAYKLPPNNIVIVQPNIDPYEKVVTGTFEAQLQKLIRLSESAIDTNTRLLVWPETALDGENLGFEEDYVKKNYFLRPLWGFLARHPQINLFSGLESFRIFDDKHSSTAIRFVDADKYYESYNAAAIFDTGGLVQSYHKSRLVPGVETLPFFLRFLSPLFEKFGGTTGGYTGQPERDPLRTTNGSYIIAPAVCYESIYGEFLSGFSKKGADLIAIITNDGWWGNTPGHLQHRDYARLRAIETGRWVVRSANTGISCIIDPRGRIMKSIPWDTEGIIKDNVPPAETATFYIRYGDILSKAAVAVAILLLVWHVSTLIKRRTSRG
ncbi:MAG TPA: apolipoprotein N-acyltransferase [Puia sp.]|nr:apolipoprotein N-acyltransferase [Puia sp.]